MQAYYCNHCGMNCDTILDAFLHIFTDHKHADMGLEQVECQRLIGKTQPYKLKTGQLSARPTEKQANVWDWMSHS